MRRLKPCIFLLLAFIVNISGFAKGKYTISKADFVSQFSNPDKLDKIYCKNEKGEKVWMDRLYNSTLYIRFDGDRKKNIRLSSIRHKNDSIIGYYSDRVKEIDRNKFKVALNNVDAIYIIASQYERIYPYYDTDSLDHSFQLRTDSLYKSCIKGGQKRINMVSKSTLDTIVIALGVCYNMEFNDGTSTNYGVVKEITTDSIFISNRINENQASFDNVEFLILAKPISAITAIVVLKSGGYSYQNLNITDYDITVESINEKNRWCPYWFRISYFDKKLIFYRVWRTQRGYIGISENEGKIYWAEG
jgi:hypothetical protein